jgi:hypothetical protein
MDGAVTVNDASHEAALGVSSTRSPQTSESSTTAITPSPANGRHVQESDDDGSSSELSWPGDSLVLGDEFQVKNCEFEVAIRPLPASQRQEYEDIRSNVVEQIIDEVSSPDGELWYQVEFRDGCHNMVSTHSTITADPAFPFASGPADSSVRTFPPFRSVSGIHAPFTGITEATRISCLWAK